MFPEIGSRKFDKIEKRERSRSGGKCIDTSKAPEGDEGHGPLRGVSDRNDDTL